MGKLFFIGDSIMAGAWDKQGGWAGRLIGKIMEETIKADFQKGKFYCMPYNLGVSGDTIADIIQRLEPEIRARIYKDEPDEKIQLIFSIGVNDSIFMTDDRRPLLSNEELNQHLETLISMSKTLASDISFIGPIPVDDDKLDPIPWANNKSYANTHIKRVEGAIEKICELHSLRFFPLFDLWLEMKDYKKYLIDGVHPNSEGHDLITQQIEEFIFTKNFIEFHNL